MLIRTVFDTRALSPKYLNQLLLLTASWHRHVRHRGPYPFEIAVIGGIPQALRDFAAALDSAVFAVEPNASDAVAKTSNTISGAFTTPGDERVLLVDNDTAFVGSPSLLDDVPPRFVAASVAGVERITPAQWDAIRAELNLSPPRIAWMSFQQELRALLTGEPEPKPIANHYMNSGVVLLPEGNEFPELWSAHVKRIADHFRNHPLGAPSLYGSNQAGLATALGTWGSYYALPLTYNFRPLCFVLGKARADEICILHLVGNVRDTGAPTLSDRLRSYWDAQILRPLEALTPRADVQVRVARQETAATHYAILESLVRDYELDAWVARFAKR